MPPPPSPDPADPGRSPAAWLSFLERELAPAPGRATATIKLVTAAVATLLICEALRVPEVAFSLYIVFFVIQKDAATSLKLGLAAMAGLTLALAAALLVTLCFMDAPWFRLPVSFALLGVAVWLSRVLVLGTLGLLLAVIFSLYLSLSDFVNEPEALVRSILWLWPICGIGVGVAVLVSACGKGAPAPPAAPAAPKRGPLIPDALTNPAHRMFALKTAAAVAACELIINATDWPGIRTAMITCVVTALATSEAAAQKQALRVVGVTVGGLLGLFSVLVLLPHMDTIFSLSLLIAGGTAVAAWVATGSARIRYAGFQIALAFYMMGVQGFAVSTDLTVIRDRFVGILLGVTMMWIFFNPPRFLQAAPALP